ncbi:BFO_1060 family glycosyltransferase [Aliarcobacter cryaerophilus]|uniref:BFO_1060 family glycosyltransferase n=1 Tax=Aliarcobacter cryaerophilus TaxID=28198 RepID=UPI003DA518B0
MSKIDILSIEWPKSDRDLHIVTPVLVYLSKKYNINYKTISIFNGYYYILKHKPKMIVISNFQGAVENNNIVNLAKSYGIKVVSLISEGNVKFEALEQFLWGHNKDKKLYVEKMLVWNKRSEDIFLKAYPNLKNRIITTGATGFDRYKLLEFKSKNRFLVENNLNFKKIIGIAAWGFDHYFDKYFEDHKEYYLNIFGEKQIDMHKEDLYKIQQIYRTIIENNKDTLFVLRFHPGTIDFEKNEFYGLEKYNNVFVSNEFNNNNLKIADLISVSDLWLGYETTTALEAWLLNKQTFLINPTRSDFIRENIHKGSPIVKTAKEAQKLIEEFYENNSIKAFEDLEENRKKIIKDTIEYDDGKNHQRAAKEIIRVLNEDDKKIKFNNKIYKEAVKQILKLILSKTIFRNRWPNLKYKSNFAKPYQDAYKLIGIENKCLKK